MRSAHSVRSQLEMKIALILTFLLSGAAANCASCSTMLYHTKHGDRACEPGTEFGCYPGEDLMWIRSQSRCGGFFRCNNGHAAVRCGSRYFHPVPGEDRLNCSCTPKHRIEDVPIAGREGMCGVHTGVDNMGGVSSAFRRLPQPLGEDPSVKCCRNKATFGGTINWYVDAVALRVLLHTHSQNKSRHIST